MTHPIPLPHTETLSSIASPLLKWYRAQARSLPWRDEPSPYRVWISEIMLQQTRVAAVMPYFERFLETLPDLPSLASCDEDTLMKLWQGLGYYNRARNLQKTARIVMEKYDGKIPPSFHALLELPGIGRYTAAAISSIAYGGNHPAVDGNVLRVITRLTLYSEDILKDGTKRAVEDALRAVYPRGCGGDMNQALMELGATVCLPNGEPHCGRCPLRSLCLACEQNCIADYPRKQKKKMCRIEKLTVLRMEEGGLLAIRRRPDKGLLAGLWELPHLPGHKTEEEVRDWCHRHDYLPSRLTPLPPARHIFSHVEWDMIGWYLKITSAVMEEKTAYQPKNSSGECLQWHSPETIAAKYSIPAAFQYYLHPEK